MSGYHIRESGSNAVQEVAFTFANARAYLDAAVARGVSVDAVAPTLFTFLTSNMDFLSEISKFRAARRTWARLMREKYGAQNPLSEQLRIFAFTAGSSLTAQQPMNNTVRTSVEMMAAALAGIQTMHVSAYDEALGVPTEEAATLALRTQQVVAYESGVTNYVDPLAGSYVIEEMTEDLANQMWAMLDDIEKRGGALECISSGYFQRELSDSAYQLALEVDRGDRIVVGVNKFQGASPSLEVFRVDPASEAAQVNSLHQLKESRDNERVAKALSALKSAAENDENTVPACIEAVKAYATVGEIVNVLREVYGKWIPNTVF